MTSDTSEQTIGTAKAAQLLDVHQSTISRMVKSGDLTGYKITPSRRNSPLRICRSSVDELLRRREQYPSAE